MKSKLFFYILIIFAASVDMFIRRFSAQIFFFSFAGSSFTMNRLGKMGNIPLCEG